MRRTSALAVLLALVVVAGCRVETDAPPSSDAPAGADQAVATLGDDALPSDADLEANRYTGRGRTAGADTAALAEAARQNPETLASFDTLRDVSSELRLPLGGDVEGPSVAKLQVLLDRAGFSPGEIDGRWGDNTELAVSAFQRAQRLRPTGIVDRATARALQQRAGSPRELLVSHRLTQADIGGPFVEIPDDVYERAELDRLGYESAAEQLGERFHASPAFLSRLNGGVDLDGLGVGDTLRVPNVRDATRPAGSVAEIVISGEAGTLQALDASGTVVFHAPVTVGSSYDPSPEGDFRVESVTRDPWWHYQPSILASVPDDQPEARLPPGPNNAVGVVWMALSKEHYGIHGTKAPGTIGYASSAGCVRLTNWDASHLASLVSAGTPVRFRAPGEARPGGAAADSARAGRSATPARSGQGEARDV